MAKRGKKKRRSRTLRGRRALPALLVALLLGGLFGWMYLSASIVHLRPAEVYVRDLPVQFDGATMLYVSDLNIRNAADARACEKLFHKLEALSPDLLLLGGDYTAATFLDVLNDVDDGGLSSAQAFLRSLARFPAAMGKFAVLGEADDADALRESFAAAGVQLLRDEGARVSRDGAELSLVGLRDAGENATPYDQIGRSFSASECVLVLAHNPLSYTRVRMSEARDGGAWADLVLSGHTLGGQMKIFGRTLRRFSEEEARRIAGWYYADDLPALVSQGVGCKGAKLRLGTQAEVWLLTLRRPSWRALGF